jgi:hypothetical protein
MTPGKQVMYIKTKRIFLPHPFRTLYHLTRLKKYQKVTSESRHGARMIQKHSYLVNGIQHIHTEGSFVIVFLLLRPLLSFGVKEVLPPKPEK